MTGKPEIYEYVPPPPGAAPGFPAADRNRDRGRGQSLTAPIPRIFHLQGALKSRGPLDPTKGRGLPTINQGGIGGSVSPP